MAEQPNGPCPFGALRQHEWMTRADNGVVECNFCQAAANIGLFAAPDLLAALEAVQNAHIRLTATASLPYCDLCGRIQPEGPADYDDRHEAECPMPQVQAAIAKASPQAP